MNTFAHKKHSNNLKRQLTRWHRRIGIISALIITLLSITGIALNHIDSLFTNSMYVSSDTLLDWYGIKEPRTVMGYSAGASNVESKLAVSDIIWADGTIIAHHKPVLFNQKMLIGAHAYEEIHYVFTNDALHLFTLDGQKIESLLFEGRHFKHAFNTLDDSVIALGSHRKMVFFNVEQMQFIKNTHPPIQHDLASLLQAKPKDTQLARRFILLKSKLLLDLHSGRFWGVYGVYIVDFFALAFLMLAMSGVYLWTKQFKINR